jgi:hypothetical protein
LILLDFVAVATQAFGFSILLFDTARMKARQTDSTADNPGWDWRETQFAYPVRYAPSGTYYARWRVTGKLIRKSLKTQDGCSIRRQAPVG